MGLDALGDAYWIEDYGERLVTAVAGKDIEDVKKVIKEASMFQPLVLFHKDADKSLLRALEGGGAQEHKQIAEMLIKNKGFMDSLSYQGLVQTEDFAISSKNYVMKDMISQCLDERRKHIWSIGVLEYLKEIKNKTVTDASGDKVMLGTPGDAVAFSVHTSDVSGLIKLARHGAQGTLDEETLHFVRSKLKKEEPETREMMEFLVDVMVERKIIYDTLTEARRSNSEMGKRIRMARNKLVSHS
jgi:hypothetical protein